MVLTPLGAVFSVAFSPDLFLVPLVCIIYMCLQMMSVAIVTIVVVVLLNFVSRSLLSLMEALVTVELILLRVRISSCFSDYLGLPFPILIVLTINFCGFQGYYSMFICMNRV